MIITYFFYLNTTIALVPKEIYQNAQLKKNKDQH